MRSAGERFPEPRSNHRCRSGPSSGRTTTKCHVCLLVFKLDPVRNWPHRTPSPSKCIYRAAKRDWRLPGAAQPPSPRSACWGTRYLVIPAYSNSPNEARIRTRQFCLRSFIPLAPFLSASSPRPQPLSNAPAFSPPRRGSNVTGTAPAPLTYPLRSPDQPTRGALYALASEA